MSPHNIEFNEVREHHPSPRALRHPFFSWAGLRPILAQHTLAEHQALQEYAGGRTQVVEIGVAEGASAIIDDVDSLVILRKNSSATPTKAGA